MRVDLPSTGLLLALAAATPAAAGSWDKVVVTPLPALKVCPDGGMKLRGSESCFQLGGRLRVEAGAARGYGARLTHLSRTGLRTLGSVSVDVRTPTELGPVRTYIRLQSQTGGPVR